MPRQDTGISRQSILSRMKFLHSKRKGGITIQEAAKHLNCSYENARKLIAGLAKDGLIVELPKDRAMDVQTGAAIFVLPNDEKALQRFAVLAAGDDVFNWFGEILDRDSFIEVVSEAVKVPGNYTDDKPVAMEMYNICLGLLGYEIAVLESGKVIVEYDGDVYNAKELKAVRERIEFMEDQMRGLADLYKSLRQNPHVWRG